MKDFVRKLYERVRSARPQVLISRPATTEHIIDQFHELYYRNADTTWNGTFWLGARVLKCPLDLWLYQEILFSTRPDVIIETGTRHGGGAFYLASICDLLGHGRVISIDIADALEKPRHPRITYIVGSSISDEVVREVESAIRQKAVMVTLDSDHERSHVLAEMRAYGRYVSKGQYMVVEDTNLNGHPVRPDFGPGPMEAVDDFLKETDAFESDARMHKFLLSFQPRGYLRRIR